MTKKRNKAKTKTTGLKRSSKINSTKEQII